MQSIHHLHHHMRRAPIDLSQKVEAEFSRLLLLFSALHNDFCSPRRSLLFALKYKNKLHVIRRKITVFRRC